VVSRLIRLGVPLTLFVLLVNPMADVVGSLRQEHRSFTDYVGETEFSIMWFVAALLFCSLMYAGLRTIIPAARHTDPPGDEDCAHGRPGHRGPGRSDLADELPPRRTHDEPATTRLDARRRPLPPRGPER